MGHKCEYVFKVVVADPLAVDVAIVWADAATRSIAQEADAIVKLHAAGILPTSIALARLGYSDDEIEQIRTARRGEALDSVGLDLKAIAS